MIKTISASLIRDVVTAGAAWLAGNGFITSQDTQGFIGSAFFLGMLLVNAILQHRKKVN